MTEVGVIGAGRMGQPIIGHLVRKGFRTQVYDIDAGKRASVQQRGAQWAADLASLAAASDAMLVCVGYDEELRALFPQLAPAARSGAIVAVLSTVHPKTVQDLAAGYAGLTVVDATMCRGGRAADEGTLLCFVGGEPATIERLRPVLGAFASDIVHTGAVGSAQAAKAANNLILWACLVADHEAQLFNYMRIARQQVGYLLNFGKKGELEWKRFILSDLHRKQNGGPIVPNALSIH